MDKNQKNDVEFMYSVCAVIIGADETLLKIHLKDGFSFQKRSMNPNVDDLDKMFDTTDMGLRREYESARLNHETLDVICAQKNRTYKRPVVNCTEQYHNDSNNDLALLDNQIRVIRLIKECPLRFTKISFRLTSERFKIDDSPSFAIKNSEITTVPEAINTRPVSSFHCTDEEAERINKALSEISFPLQDKSLNSCHGYYDLSYHTEKSISITLLITALEILFLENDHGSKKEMLAKRCACYLYDDDDDQTILSTYNRLKEEYKKRSEFVHDGKANGILDEDILFLRECVRKSLLKAMSLTESKKQRITRLQSVVVTQKSLFGE